MRRFTRGITIASLSIALAALAAMAGSSSTPDPVAGSWKWTISAEGELHTGTLTITETDEGLAGSIYHDQGGSSLELQDPAFQDSTLTFSIYHPDYGTIRTEATVTGDELSGTIVVSGYDRYPIRGTREKES